MCKRQRTNTIEWLSQVKREEQETTREDTNKEEDIKSNTDRYRTNPLSIQ